MKPIRKDELFDHFSQFLKTKGVEMKDGAYTQRIQKGCGLLADAINLSQKSLQRVKTEVDTKLDQVRQVIHEKTAPPPPAAASAPAGSGKARAGATAGKAARAKGAPKAKSAKAGGRKR